jgi:hypothetical protein
MQAVLCIGLAFGCRGALNRAKPMQAVLCTGLAFGCRGVLKWFKPMQAVLCIDLAFGCRGALERANRALHRFSDWLQRGAEKSYVSQMGQSGGSAAICLF